MIPQSAFQLAFDFLPSKPVVVEPTVDQVSSDAGLLPFRQLDERIGLTRQLTLAIDLFDDPTHGQQQLTFFHGYYDQYRYLPRIITCAENDLVLSVCLLYGSAHPTLGAADDLEYVVRRLRKPWPGVRIHLRGDSGFGTPTMDEASEQLDIQYSFGIGMNARLKKLSDA